jgi:hypothetical protein
MRRAAFIRRQLYVRRALSKRPEAPARDDPIRAIGLDRFVVEWVAQQLAGGRPSFDPGEAQ